MLKLKTTKMEVEGKAFSLLSFEIEGGVIEPSELKDLEFPDDCFGSEEIEGIVFSGRGPIWLYAALVHHPISFKWIGTYDPRLGGAVIVDVVLSELEIGDVLKFELPKD